MRRIFLFLTVFLILTGCGEETVYKKFNRNFSDNRWMKQDIRVYKFTIAEEGNYDIQIDYSHVYDTPLSSVPVRVSLHRDGQELYQEPVSIIIRDENGKQVGDCVGDYCDIRQTALKGKKLGKGDYDVRLTNLFDFDYMPNILGIGIRVVKNKNQ